MGALGTTVDPRFSSWARASSQPPSLAAYQLYADGIDLYWQRNYARAADAFFDAARSEATFTAPLVWAALSLTGDWFANEGATDSERWGRADSITSVLEAMKSDLPTWERAMVDYTRASLWQDAPAAYAAIKRVNEYAPDSEWLLQQAEMGTNLDRPYEVLATLDRIDPDWRWFEDKRGRYYGLRLHQLHRIGDYDTERALVLQWKAENPGRSPFSALRSVIAVGDRSDVEREFRSTALGKDRWLGRAWIELVAHGYDDLADEAAEASLRGLLAAPEADRNEHWKRNVSHQLTKLERYDEALEMLVPLDPTADGYFDGLGSVGFLKAQLGDREEALRIFDEMEAAPDKDFARMQRASILVALGERERAMQEFRAMRIRGVMHPEAFAPELEDYPPFADWLKPRG
jgi:tetratricopeptide (TPR) repeat protein